MGNVAQASFAQMNINNYVQMSRVQHVERFFISYVELVVKKKIRLNARNVTIKNKKKKKVNKGEKVIKDIVIMSLKKGRK